MRNNPLNPTLQTLNPHCMTNSVLYHLVLVWNEDPQNRNKDGLLDANPIMVVYTYSLHCFFW